jgi:hypothetical protein
MLSPGGRHREDAMKDTRKARKWRNVLVLQASVAALFLPFVIGLAVMFILAGHDDRPVRTADRTVTGSTR